MSFEIRQGDVLERLREIEDCSVNCVVTSPPYWGLRDYGTGKWIDGDPDKPDCAHESNRGKQGQSGQRADREHTQKVIFTDQCRKCGAIRVDKQIGLENTPESFVDKLTEVFREVRRVLTDDGTCWVNIGDSYNSQPGQRKQGIERNDVAGWKQRALEDGQTQALIGEELQALKILLSALHHIASGGKRDAERWDGLRKDQ